MLLTACLCCDFVQIWMRLIDAGMMTVCARLRGREVTREETLGVHSPDAWQTLEAATADKESPAAKEASAARTAAGCVLEMAMAVVKGDLKNGVALVRPCGRRVGRDLTPYVFCCLLRLCSWLWFPPVFSPSGRHCFFC